MSNLILVSIFGVCGILCRYGIDQSLNEWSGWIPIGTLAINVLGSIVAGVIFVLSDNEQLSENLRTALLVGFCGGFTTFSAYTLQTLQMMDRGKMSAAIVYIILSPVLGLVGAFFAIVFTRKLLG